MKLEKCNLTEDCKINMEMQCTKVIQKQRQGMLCYMERNIITKTACVANDTRMRWEWMVKRDETDCPEEICAHTEL